MEWGTGNDDVSDSELRGEKDNCDGEGDINKILHEMLFEILQKPPKLLANSREVSAAFHAVFHAVLFFGERA